MLALFDSGSKVNVLHLTFTKKLGLVVRSTNVSAQKIDGTTFETYGMVVVVFSVTNQADIIKFFEETFLVANVSPHVVFGMLFLILSDANIDFPKREL